MADSIIPGRIQTEISIMQDEQEAVAMIEQIDWMLEEGGERYRWAEDTLTGIRETIMRTQKVSSAQRRAVHNIEDAGNR